MEIWNIWNVQISEKEKKSSFCLVQMVKDQHDLANSHSRNILKSLKLTMAQVVMSITFPLCSLGNVNLK